MDRPVPPATWTPRRLLFLAGSLGLLLLIGGAYYRATAGESRLRVPAERVSIAEVQRGAFQEFIPVNGVVQPVNTIYLDALEGGRIEEKLVEDGALLRQGQPILRLSNTDLELSLVNQETSVFNLLTQMQISRNAARQNTITKRNQLEDADNAFREAERLYLLNKTLVAKQAIGSQEFRQSEIAYQYQARRRRLTQEVLRQDSASTRQELAQAQASYQRTQNALRLMHRKVDDLIVRAPVAGQLTALDAEVGQNKNQGERLGQLDVLSGFKVRVGIDENYIARVVAGQRGECTLGGQTFPLEVKKVFTQVVGGRFQVDMAFAGAVPAGIRRGQTLQIRLALSDAAPGLLLARGGFYQQTGGNWVFKLAPDGKTAYKTDVRLGRQNPDYYEILHGLQPGDRVITSSYENYTRVQELMLE